MRRLLRMCLIGLSLLALSACKTGEEKANEFYQSGLTLYEAGDLDRAAIEFLNVFQHNGFHQDARRKLADIRLEQGRVVEAYSQYLRLIEQYPDTPDVRIILARVAIDNNNWDEASRHGMAAFELVPMNAEAQAIANALSYREATEAEDNATLASGAQTARALLDANPDDDVSRRVVIDALMRSDAPMRAMPEIEAALARDPDSYPYHSARLGLLQQAEDLPAVGTQLRRMVALFPEDQILRQSLLAWHLDQNDMAGAEAFLRQLAGPDEGPTAGHITFVQFLQATQGPDAARQELDRLASLNDGNPNADLYQSMSSVIRYEAGEKDAAMATLRTVLDTAAPSVQTWQIQNTFARLLIAEGDEAGARHVVDAILAADSANVDALKLHASWLIADDQADAAILDLRKALSQQPRDPETLLLMAQAHMREGNRALAGERLALAVDVTNAAPREAVLYANFLMEDDRAAAARSVLTDARSEHPDHVEVLTTLARVLLREGAWIEAQGVANALRALEVAEAQDAARSLQAALLLGQNRVADSLAFLEEEIAQGNADATAVAQVIQIHLQSGNPDTARTYLDEALLEAPDDPTLQMLNASLYAVAGEFDAAERVFRDLIAADPQAEAPVLRLYNLLISTDQADKAEAVLAAALIAQPRSQNLHWIHAGQLEDAGEIDAAIAIYEKMYAVDSSSVMIANNLASLIATHRDDADSIARAATIAKRLRELEAPPVQDTYGWIAYRQGNFEEARRYLEPAAAGLPGDPLVQYHLGMTYAALGDIQNAAQQLTRALDLAGDNPLPQFDLARAKLSELGE